jgi:hypothetical protein
MSIRFGRTSSETRLLSPSSEMSRLSFRAESGDGPTGSGGRSHSHIEGNDDREEGETLHASLPCSERASDESHGTDKNPGECITLGTVRQRESA